MTRVVILLHTLSYWGLTKALSGGDSFSEWAESHPDKWMNVPIITDSLGEEGRYKVHLLMQGLPHKIQKYTRAFGLTRIDKNPAFLTLILPPPLKHLLTYIWQSVQNTHVLLLQRWQSQREDRRPIRKQCRHFIMEPLMNTSTNFL